MFKIFEKFLERETTTEHDKTDFIHLMKFRKWLIFLYIIAFSLYFEKEIMSFEFIGVSFVLHDKRFLGILVFAFVIYNTITYIMRAIRCYAVKMDVEWEEYKDEIEGKYKHDNLRQSEIVFKEQRDKLTVCINEHHYKTSKILTITYLLSPFIILLLLKLLYCFLS